MGAAKIIAHSNHIDSSHFKPASFKSRFFAVFIDAFLNQLLVSALVFIFKLIDPEMMSPDQPLLYVGSVLLITTSSYFFVICVPLIFTGQSPGKRIMNIQLVSAVPNSTLEISQVLSREFIYKFFSWILFGVGFLMTFWTHRKVTLHDKLSKTEVVSIN